MKMLKGSPSPFPHYLYNKMEGKQSFVANLKEKEEQERITFYNQQKSIAIIYKMTQKSHCQTILSLLFSDLIIKTIYFTNEKK